MRIAAALLLSLAIVLGGYDIRVPAQAQSNGDSGSATPAVCATAPQPSATPRGPTSPMAGGSTLAVNLATLPAALVGLAAIIAAAIAGIIR